MAQKYSNNEIPNLDADWGQDLQDDKQRPYSNGAVQRFLKSKMQEQMNALEGKIGWLTYEAGNIVFMDKQDGIRLGSIALSGTIYSITLDSNTNSSFYILTSETNHYITVTPSSKSGTLGSSMSDYIEDYTYSISVDNGSGTFREIMSGSCVNGSSFSADVRNYVITGNNRIRVIVTGESSGQSKSLVYSCTVTNLSLTCSCSWYKPFIQGESYYLDKIYFGGNMSKTLYVMIDDDEEQLYSIKFSSGTNYITTDYQFNITDKFPKTGSGVHKFEIWMGGDGVETQHYSYNIMCIESSDVSNISLVCINEVVPKAVNFNSQTIFKYATYNATSVLFNIYGYDNGDMTQLVSDSSLKVQTQTKYEYSLNLELDTESKDNVSLLVTADVTGCNQSTEIVIDNSNSYAAVDNATFYLDSTNRNNGSLNREEFINSSNSPEAAISSYIANWHGFAWSTDGWATDADNNKCLVVNAGSSVEVPEMKPLISASTQSLSIELKFRCSNPADYNTPILSIMDTETYNERTTNGIILFPTKILVLSSTNRLVTPQSVNLDEDKITHLVIVFQRNYNNTGRNLCRIYVNSYQNAVFEYSGNASFGSGYLRLGQTSADTYLYMFRYYENRVLEESDVLGNFMNTLIDSAEYNRKSLRHDNNILDSGTINYELCKNAGYNIMVVQTVGDTPIPSINQQSTVKSTLTLEYNDHPEWNVTIENAPCDGQGTTSKRYYRWNLRWKLKDAAIWTYADGTTSTKSGYLAGTNHPKCNKITAKKNYASSSQGHKMGATAMYDDLYNKLGLKTSLPSETARVAVYQYPVMGFQKFEDGTYEFIGLYTIGPDKGDSKTFGYDGDKYPYYLSLEGPNHNPLATRFLHPWTDTTIYNPDAETLEFGGQEGWDCDSCPYETDDAADQANIQSLLESEWKPAYDIVYYCSPYIRSLSEIGYTLEQLNNNINTFRNSMDILGNRKNEVLELYDANYNIIYYDNSTEQYETLENSNIVSYLNGYLSTNTPTTSQIITARKAKFYAEASNYFSIDDATYHACYCELIGASDNHAKNSYPFKFKRLVDGGRWCWRQDDLDTIMATDNNGQSTKSYSIEVGDITSDGTDIFQGASSVFWTLIDECFSSEKKSMMLRLINALVSLAQERNLTGAYMHETIYNMFDYYFWSNSSGYFPSLSYNKDATWSYITPWSINPAQSYNNVYPLTQALGTQKDAEKLWVKRRIIYIMSQYQIGGFTGSTNDGYGSIEFTPATTFTFKVTPSQDMYPSGNKGGGQDIKGARTTAGNVCNIIADSDGSTTFYLKAVDLLTDIGDLSGLRLTTRGGDASIGASLSISSKKLRKLKVGDEDASKVVFNAASLSVSGECIEEIDARNASTIKNSISLLGCPRLKRVYFDGTNSVSVILPQGAKIEEISYPDGLQTLFLHSLPLLTDEHLNLSETAIDNITGIYYYNCPKISPFTLLRRIYKGGSNLKFVTMIWDDVFEGTSDDLDMIASFAKQYNASSGEGYGCITFDPENNLISNSSQRANLQGTININGYAYEDSVNTIRNYFGANLSLNMLGYYIRFKSDNVRQLCADNWGDGTGLTPQWASNVTSLGDVFYQLQGLYSFDEFVNFTGLTGNHSYIFSESDITTVTMPPVEIYYQNNTGAYNASPFCNCKHLTRVNWGNCSISHIKNSNNAYNLYRKCTSLDYYEGILPKNITTVEGTFLGCTSLTKMIFPEGLINSVGQEFRSCTNIVYVEYPTTIQRLELNEITRDANPNGIYFVIKATTPPTVQNTITPHYNTTMYFYVPDESVNAYKAANGWSTYADYIRPLSQLPSEYRAMGTL